MSDSLKYKIFDETDCIPEQTMFDYIDKLLNAKECHAVEKHLLHCELCSDAMEGLELVKNRDRITTINQKISERIAAPIKENKIIAFNYKLIVSIAASILLLIGGVFFFNQFNQKDAIAEFKSTEALPSPPPPTPLPIDETIREKENSVPAEESKGVLSAETEAKESDRLIAKQKQESTAEGKPAQEQSIVASGAGAASRKSVDQSKIVPSEEYDQAITIPAPAKSDNYVSQDVLSKNLKDNSDVEMEKSEAKPSGADEDRLELPEPTISTEMASKANVYRNDAYTESDDKKTEAKKSPKAKKTLSSKIKENRSASKESLSGDVAGGIAYDAPQSKVNDERSAEMGAIAQSSEKQEQNVYEVVGQMPTFPGGQDSLQKFIHRNFNYPANSDNERKNKSTIYVTFIVQKDGIVYQATIFKGINPELDKEALRVVGKMPKWKPGKNNGEAVAVRMTLPVKLE